MSTLANELIKYLQDCLDFIVENHANIVEAVLCAEKGLKNFDIYTCIDFIEK